ncbi:MAG: hypothetical protein Q8N73_01945, partial [bacterium]|nr:hypothetical protein [bacterium]
GVYLSTKMPFPSDKEIEDGAKVYLLTSTIDDLSTMVDGEIKSWKIVNRYVIEKEGEPLEKLDFYYGMILHDRKNREGDCGIIRSFGTNYPTTNVEEVTISESNQNKPASITVFREVEAKEANVGKVILYSGEERTGDNLSLEWPTTEEKDLPPILWENVWSIEIRKGNYLLFLRGKNAIGTPMCATFERSVPSLKGLLINQCVGPHPEEDPWWKFWRLYDKSCAQAYALFLTK